MIYAVRDAEPVNARVMVKGDPKTLGPEVQRGFLQILGGQKVPTDHKGSGRDLLAALDHGSEESVNSAGDGESRLAVAFRPRAGKYAERFRQAR